MNSICPKCKGLIQGVFPHVCPECGFDVSDLAGKGTSSFQKKKWREHTDLLYGDTVSLYDKKYNASFHYKGVADIEDMVRFTITYGDLANTKDSRGIHDIEIILSYFPEIVGSGTAIAYRRAVPCSGVMLISPSSFNYAHACPLIDDWVEETFPSRTSQCRFCGKGTDFGQPICADCYSKGKNDWTDFL